MQSEPKLTDYTDLVPEEFAKALARVDWNAWKKTPEKALAAAGVKLKPGVCFKEVASKEEADNLPRNELPLLFNQERRLDLNDLSVVAGGDIIRSIFSPISYALSKIPGWQGPAE